MFTNNLVWEDGGLRRHMFTLAIWFGRMECRDHHIFTSNLVWEAGGQRPFLCSQIICEGWRDEAIIMVTIRFCMVEDKGHSYVHK